MASGDTDDKGLRASALKNIEVIQAARQKAERDLVSSNDALEQKSKELSEQREWFEVTLSSIGDAVITTDTTASVTFLNPVAEAMTGWTSQEAQGQSLETVFRIINEDTLQTAPNPIREVLQTGNTIGLANHTAIVHRSGRTTAIEDSAAPIRDGAGAIVGAVMVFHDVTERRKVERALRASEEQFRTIFEQVPAGVALVELDTTLSRVNERFSEILGYSPEELRRMTFRDFTHPDDMQLSHAHVAQLDGGKGSGYASEKRYIRKDGSVVWSHTVVEILRDDEGNPSQYIGIIEDITARKAAADAVRETAQRMALALSAGNLSDWSWDVKTDVVTIGARLRELFGVPADTVVKAEHLRDYLRIEDAEAQRAAARKALAERTPFNLEYRIVRPGSKEEWLTARGLGVYGADGSMLGMIGVAQEITEQKRTDIALSRLAAVIESSHDAVISKDLNGIIQTWNGAAELMFGYPAAETVGRSILILVPDHLQHEEAQILGKIRAGERVEHYETTRKRKDGTLLTVSLSVSPIKDAQRRVVGASKRTSNR